MVEKQANNDLKLTRKATMTKFIRSVSIMEGTRITDDAKDTLMDQLEQLSIILFRRAEELSRESQRITVYSEDFEEAYEELMKPHVFIEEIVAKLEEQKDELKNLAKKSVIRHMEV